MTNLSSRNLRTMIVLSVGTIIVSACGATTASATPTLPAIPTATNAPLFQQVTLTTTSSEDDGQSPPYKITTQTPSLTGSDDARVKNFNAEMTDLVTKAVADFNKKMADMSVPIANAESSFDVRYKLLSPSGNLFSLKFEMEGYVSAMAHPYHVIETLNYNLEQGSDISIADLFLPNSAYLQTIATYCAAQLKTRDIGFQDDFTKGADPTPDNYHYWNITADGLLITFVEYQVAPYVSGPQTVTVPYSELKSLIDPHGPLGNVPK